MSLIGVREFSRRVSALVEHVEKSHEPAIITRHGRPVVALIPLDAESFVDLVLAHVPEFALSMRAANDELARGETTSLSDALEEIEAEESRETEPRAAGRASRR